MQHVLDPRYSSLLARLYGGIDAERPWESFLEALADWLQADFATLIIAARGRPLPGTFVSPGADPARVAEYMERLFAQDPFRDLPDGRVTSFAEFLAQREPEQLAEYREYLALAGGEQVLAVDLRFPNRFEARFRLTRRSERDNFTAQDRARLQELVPHLRTAVELFERLEFARAEHSVYRSATDGLGLALLVLDRELRPVSANHLAERLLSEGEGVRLAGGKLRFAAAEAGLRLAELLDGGAALGIARFRIARPEHGDLVVTARAIDLPATHSGAGALALFLARPWDERLQDPETISALLGVTPAEGRLCAMLGKGHSLGEAAEVLGIAYNTAKVQLRSIFTKTQVNRQAQLISLLRQLPG